MPRLFKENDPRIGDSGSMSLQVWPDGVPNPGRPKVGCAIRVGSLFARSYSNQDWWQTSLIVEVLEDTEDRVKFRTQSGSVYIWEV